MDFCLVFRFYAGFVNGHSNEYDVIKAVVSSLRNVSLVVKEFNISDNTNIFNIGEIYKKSIIKYYLTSNSCLILKKHILAALHLSVLLYYLSKYFLVKNR